MENQEAKSDRAGQISPLMEESKPLRIQLFLSEDVLQLFRGLSKSDNKRASFLNSPFIVTVVGGLMIAIIGFVLQTNSASKERELQHQRSLQARKIALVAELATQFERAVEVEAEWTRLEHWVVDHLRDKPNDIYGRTFLEVVKRRDELRNERVAPPTLDSVMIQIEVVFRSQSVHDKIKQIRQGGEDQNRHLLARREYYEWYDYMSGKRDELVRAMVEEINTQAQ